MTEDWFIYGHFRNTDSEPFYVGIGKNARRPYDMTNNRSEWHKSVVRKHGVKIKILHDKLTKESAAWWERIWIRSLKMSGIRLVNLTDGGEGISGYRHTDETKKKIGEHTKSLGNNHQMKDPEIRARVSRTKIQNYKLAGKNHPNRMKGENHPSKRPDVISKIKKTMKDKSYIYLTWYNKCMQWQHYWGA